MRTRKGGLVLFAIGLLVLSFALVFMPDTAQMILPGIVLEKHPSFYTEQTSRSCDLIEMNGEAADDVWAWAQDEFGIEEDIDFADSAYGAACADQCDDLGNYYCSDGDLACVCRMQPDSSG